jgi:glucose/arabinose dehydrogenase
VAVVHAGDGSGRLFIVENRGTILIHDGDELLASPFADLSDHVTGPFGEQGLLGLAFHPDYVVNGLFFVSYTDTSGDSTLARMSVSAEPNRADPASLQEILTFSQPDSDHNGGDIHFGPDGYLYFAAGDGGHGASPDAPQEGDTLLGKILRLDVDGEETYAIPPDNPFVGVLEVRDEIWALGLRNPWRFSFDSLTGDLFVGDVGAQCREEIDHVPAGSPGGFNFGWRVMEGSLCWTLDYCNPTATCDDTSFTPPVLEYDHTAGEDCAVIGGYRYRGSSNPSLWGLYLFGDVCSGRIWGATEQSGSWIAAELADTALELSAFGEDERGELYALSITDDGLYRLLTPDGLFGDGFETGDVGLWSGSVGTP